jgi:hypothetical protein
MNAYLVYAIIISANRLVLLLSLMDHITILVFVQVIQSVLRVIAEIINVPHLVLIH